MIQRKMHIFPGKLCLNTVFISPFVSSVEWEGPSEGHVYWSQRWKEAFGPLGGSDGEASGKRNIWVIFSAIKKTQTNE